MSFLYVPDVYEVASGQSIELEKEGIIMQTTFFMSLMECEHGQGQELPI